MSTYARFELPDDLYYSSMEYFECPYDHNCTGCEYDCREDDDL